jgi:hypothetical protein
LIALQHEEHEDDLPHLAPQAREECPQRHTPETGYTE